MFVRHQRSLNQDTHQSHWQYGDEVEVEKKRQMIVMQMINTFLGLLLLIARSDHGKIKREENENKCFASDSFF